MKNFGFLLLLTFTFYFLNTQAQTWQPTESSHFGVDGFETADFFHLTAQQLDDEYQWEASGIRNMNIAWNRTLSPAGGQFRWELIEPAKGTYDWSKPDAFVKKVQALGIQLLVLIHPFTPWDQPGKHSMDYDKPNDMTAFKKFIAKLVERYDNDGIDDMPDLLYPIKYYEIGNEPEGQTFGDSPGTYNDFMNTLKAAYDTAKVVYPNVKIVVGGATPIYEPHGFLNAVDTFWKGALNRPNVSNYFDVFNFHFFVGTYTQDISVYIDYWKQLLSTYGIAGKEIWITETGNYSGTCTGSDNQQWPDQSSSYQASWWLKHAFYALTNGISKLFWVFYYSDQTDWKSHVAFINIDKTTKKAVYFTNKLMAEKIDAFSDAVQNSYSAVAQYQTAGNFKFTVAGKQIYLLWNDANGNVTLNSLNTGTVRITKGVPQLNGDGSVALDNSGDPTFDTATVTVTNGQATIPVTSTPVYVEEIAAPPSVPILVSPTDNTTGVAVNTTLSWNASNGATSYRLQISVNQNFSTTIFDQSNISTTSQQVSGLSNSTQYYWRVNAINNNGTSNWSNVWSFTTQGIAPNAPTLLSPANGAVNQPTTLTLNWNASSGAVSYRLQVSSDANFSTTKFDQSSITNASQQVSGLLNSTLYYWHVNATSADGTSSYSSAWSFTTVNPTLVDRNDSEKSKKFSLFQNYPNPFNPETVINYQLPVKSFVTLKIYDLLGKEISTLVNEEQLSGDYERVFNGTFLPSGIYFYVLNTGNHTAYKKMMLLK